MFFFSALTLQNDVIVHNFLGKNLQFTTNGGLVRRYQSSIIYTMISLSGSKTLHLVAFTSLHDEASKAERRMISLLT